MLITVLVSLTTIVVFLFGQCIKLKYFNFVLYVIAQVISRSITNELYREIIKGVGNGFMFCFFVQIIPPERVEKYIKKLQGKK